MLLVDGKPQNLYYVFQLVNKVLVSVQMGLLCTNLRVSKQDFVSILFEFVKVNKFLVFITFWV